ncbi:MAG: hypothetical protein NC241_02715 [Bacteroides sp.]|nr:hypothetical protein [Bacteroides sp.]MCM1456477.1 hypothetical protein [Lachnoclostridium sp.]
MAQFIAYLQKSSFNSRRLADIVNNIRRRPSDFPRMAQLRHRPIVHTPGVPQPQRSPRLLLLSITIADIILHASDN